jgi:hypothetical protein
MRPAVEPQASPEQEVDFLLADLLRGVALTDEEMGRARAIVRADVTARRAELERRLAILRASVQASSEVTRPAPHEPGSAWDRDMAIRAERDAALAALLRTDVQRATFAENAAAQRRMIEEVLSRARRQSGGGPVGG